MNFKNLKFLVGGLTLAVVAVVVIFAASPSHAQADDASEGATELVANEVTMGSELCADTKDCSTECMKNEECKKQCSTVCTPTCK